MNRIVIYNWYFVLRKLVSLYYIYLVITDNLDYHLNFPIHNIQSLLLSQTIHTSNIEISKTIYPSSVLAAFTPLNTADVGHTSFELSAMAILNEQGPSYSAFAALTDPDLNGEQDIEMEWTQRDDLMWNVCMHDGLMRGSLHWGSF